MPDCTQIWGNVAQIVSAVGAAGALVLGVRALVTEYYIGRAIQFERRYKKHRAYLITFWNILRAEYHRFNAIDTTTPSEPEELAFRTGLPERVDGDLRDWRRHKEKFLNSDQRKMLLFVSRIYPPGGDRTKPLSQRSSIVPADDAEAFHKARGELATFWDTEAWAVRSRHLRSYQSDAKELLILLSWLEIALQESTQARGPGKVRLFEAAGRLMQ